MCRMSWKSESLNLLEPSGPHRACYGTALPLPFFWYSWDCASLIYSFKYNQQHATLCTILHYCRCSTCFGWCLRPSSGAQELYTQHLVRARLAAAAAAATASVVGLFQPNHTSGSRSQMKEKNFSHASRPLNIKALYFSKRQEPIAQWPGIISQKMVFSVTAPWKPEDCHSDSCFSVTN
jgi:hypothetical protein